MMYCKSIFTLLLVVGLCWSLSAQPKSDWSTQLLTTAQSKLDLSPEQSAQLSTLRSELQQQLDALAQQKFETPAQRHLAKREIMQSQRVALEDILSEEQQTELRRLMEEQRQAHRAAWENVDYKALHQEIKTYRQENIQPVMQAQRTKLDASISAEDQAMLLQIRTEMKAAREAAKAARAVAKEERKSAHQRRPPMQREKMSWQWLQDNPDYKAELMDMRARYDHEISRLLTEIAPQQKQWEAELKAIHARYKPANNGAEAPYFSRKNTDDLLRKGTKMRFLLMPPVDEEARPALPVANLVAQASLSPNPAAGQTTLSFTLPAESMVRVELRNQSGQLIRTLSNELFRAERNDLVIDLTSLPPGAYYLTLTDKLGSQSLPLMVKN